MGVGQLKTPKVKMNTSIERAIVKKLRDLGVPANLNGYEYLKIGLSIVLEDPSITSNMTKGLYPKIAEEAGSTSSKVERSIRQAVESCFNRLTTEQVKEYFGNTPSYWSGKLCNSAFLACVAEIIREEAGVYD